MWSSIVKSFLYVHNNQSSRFSIITEITCTFDPFNSQTFSRINTGSKRYFYNWNLTQKVYVGLSQKLLSLSCLLTFWRPGLLRRLPIHFMAWKVLNIHSKILTEGSSSQAMLNWGWRVTFAPTLLYLVDKLTLFQYHGGRQIQLFYHCLPPHFFKPSAGTAS